MLKTVKVKKNMGLDELIKYVWENSATEKRVFLGNHGQRVVFDNVGGFYPSGYAYSPDTTFTVEMEEEITKDTKFEWLVEASDTRIWTQSDASIRDVLEEGTNEIRALINGKLELIHERNVSNRLSN